MKGDRRLLLFQVARSEAVNTLRFNEIVPLEIAMSGKVHFLVGRFKILMFQGDDNGKIFLLFPVAPRAGPEAVETPGPFIREIWI